MIKNHRILAIIPARGGSKGVPRKNIRLVGGKPLISWTIDEAKNSQYIDRLILSSEDEEIINIAQKWGCEVPFVRPNELAQDSTPGIEPVLHALHMLPDYDFVVLLQPTSPLRSATDIDGCIEKCINSQAKACVSVAEADENPYWMYNINDKGLLNPLLDSHAMYTRRQDLPKVFVLNGAVYVANCQWLIKSRSFLTSETLAYPMPKERSVDIDTEMDLKYLEFLKGEIKC